MGQQGIPSLVLEENDKRAPVDVSGFLGKPEAFAAYLSASSGPTG